jgi:hypothetical protein
MVWVCRGFHSALPQGPAWASIGHTGLLHNNTIIATRDCCTCPAPLPPPFIHHLSIRCPQELVSSSSAACKVESCTQTAWHAYEYDAVAFISNCRDKHVYSRVKFINELVAATPDLRIGLFGACFPGGRDYVEKTVRCVRFSLHFLFLKIHLMKASASPFFKLSKIHVPLVGFPARYGAEKLAQK